MENFKTLTHKRGRGRSPEVVFYKRLQYRALTGKFLVFWKRSRLYLLMAGVAYKR